MARRRISEVARMGIAAGTAWVVVATAAWGQAERPLVPPPDGPSFRYIPILPHLPPDPKRDQFFDTRWADKPPSTTHVNNFRNGGLYGRRFRHDCTTCVPAYRTLGVPGGNATGPGCEPGPKGSRLLGNFLHPFQPVGSYYAGGCYVPIYDLDPVVSGPGPFPWPHFWKRPTGG